MSGNGKGRSGMNTYQVIDEKNWERAMHCMVFRGSIMRRTVRLSCPYLSRLINLLWMGYILDSLRIGSRDIWNHFRSGGKCLLLTGQTGEISWWQANILYSKY